MITAEKLSLVAGILVSLAAFYLPIVGPWYEKQEAKTKAQIMGLAIILTGAGSFILAFYCVGPFCLPQPIDLPNQVWALVLTIASALISNQGTYMLVRKLHARAA